MCHRAPALSHALAFQFGNVRQVPDSGEISCKGLFLFKEPEKGSKGSPAPAPVLTWPPPRPQPWSEPRPAPGTAQHCNCCTSVPLRTSPSLQLPVHSPHTERVTAQPTPREPAVTTELRPCCSRSCRRAGVKASTAVNPGLALGVKRHSKAHIPF